MKSIYLYIVFAIMVVAQWWVPTQMILDKEDVIEQGTSFKFETVPLDPFDPYRGKYIDLYYKEESFATKDTTWVRGEILYLHISNGDDGFAQVTEIGHDIQDRWGSDYIETTVRSYYGGDVFFRLPFNRYYMEESKAYDAELAHREAQRNSEENKTYALVYVKDGEAVLDDVFINDVSIKEYVEK